MKKNVWYWAIQRRKKNICTIFIIFLLFINPFPKFYLRRLGHFRHFLAEFGALRLRSFAPKFPFRAIGEVRFQPLGIKLQLLGRKIALKILCSKSVLTKFCDWKSCVKSLCWRQRVKTQVALKNFKHTFFGKFFQIKY